LQAHDGLVGVQVGRDLVVGCVRSVAHHVEAHDVAGGIEARGARDAEVLQDHPVPDLAFGEVDNDLVAFGHADAEAAHAHGLGSEPAVVGYYGERIPRAERQAVPAGDRGVEDSEPVLAPLHLHDGPGLAVDQDHVTEEVRVPRIVEDKPAVLGEDLVLDDQREIVLAVAFGYR
jgi:hypothetical protein